MKKKRLMITLLLVISILMCVGFAYAYLAAGVNNDRAQTASITTGTMNLTFADGTTVLNATEITIGESVTKTFTIENTGSLDATASMYFKNLKNTYMERSLIYTLEYSTSENGTYTVLRKDATMPRSDAGAKELIYGRITVPAGTKRYYKLTVTFIDTGIDQSADVNATFNTSFTLESGHDTTSESDKTLAALGLTEYLNEGEPDFTMAATTDEGIFAAEDNYGTSYYFRGDVQNNTLKMGTVLSNDVYEGHFPAIGDDIIWKIIRINGDGTLRIIATNVTIGEDVNENEFGERTDTYHAGWWAPSYEYLNVQKAQWYSFNLSDNYDDYISYDTMFCFDTNYYKTEYVTYDTDYGHFEGYANSYDAQLRETNPSLYCNLPKDDMNSGQTRLTGNDGLGYPIATVTLDELIMAGMSTSATSNTYIPNIDSYGFVTMTPYKNNLHIPSAGGSQVTNALYGLGQYYEMDQDTTSGSYNWEQRPTDDNALYGVGHDADDSNPGSFPVINLKADYAREFIWDAVQNAYVHP